MSASGRGGAAQEVAIRRAGPADCAAIAALDLEARRWGYRDLFDSQALGRLTDETREARWRDALAPGSSQRLWVASRGGRELGFAAWAPAEPGVVELAALYVVEEAAGAGVAGALMRVGLADAVEERYASASLWVLEANGRARRFYERCGWTCDGTRKTIVRRGVALRSVRYVTRV